MTSLHVRDFGSGKAILLLGGCPTPAEHLLPLAERLAARYRVLLPDLPGYGRSALAEGAFSMTAAQERIEGALFARGVSELAIVGLSLGAYRAFALALGKRVSVRAVVALGALAGLDDSGREGMRQFAAAAAASVDLGDALVARLLSADYAATHPAISAQVRTWQGLLPPAALAAELTAVAECEDLRPHLGQLRIPILARVGALDLAAPPPLSEEIGRLAPRARVEIVPGRGHLLLFEDADATIAAVESALASLNAI